MKTAALGITLSILLVLPVFFAGETTPLILLLPLAATFTLLVAKAHPTSSTELGTLMLLMGLGLGFMMIPGTIGRLFLAGILIVLILLLLRQKIRSRFPAYWGIGLYGFALTSLLISLVFSPPTASILLFLSYAVLLPVCPLHGASIVSFSRLNGILPNFLALFLPALGLHGVLMIRADLPTSLMGIVVILALIGTIYGGIRALVQTNIRHRLAYAGFSFWSILWWYLAGSGTENAPAILYFCALALIMQGLFIAGYCLEKRQGDLNLDQLGGLARLMPRFGVCLSLMVAAAMGLPFFGSFTALIAMLTSPSITLSWGFVIILLAWLLSSLHFPLFTQRILLGSPKPDRRYRDLFPSETLSLTLIVAMIVLLGIAPYAFIDVGQTPPVQEAGFRQ